MRGWTGGVGSLRASGGCGNETTRENKEVPLCGDRKGLTSLKRRGTLGDNSAYTPCSGGRGVGLSLLWRTGAGGGGGGRADITGDAAGSKAKSSRANPNDS